MMIISLKLNFHSFRRYNSNKNRKKIFQASQKLQRLSSISRLSVLPETVNSVRVYLDSISKTTNKRRLNICQN